MDLKKTGMYIAAKRKKLGLTQKQLAEKLGMSDKSVSKWERGICLPDVSVYMELCEILGISINEFLAGEDISKIDVIKKSEDNLICLSRDSKKRQNKLKKIIAVLSVIIGCLLGGGLVFRINTLENYIAPADRDGAEMKIAEILSGVDGAYLFEYFTEHEYTSLDVYLSEYHGGKLYSKNKVAELSLDQSASDGMIVLIPGFEQFKVKLIVADQTNKYSIEIPILKNVENREYYGRSVSQIEDDIRIIPDTEQGLVALIYGEDGLSAVPLEDIGKEESEVRNDYVYYFSFRFSKY